jgi:hypothetical protein
MMRACYRGSSLIQSRLKISHIIPEAAALSSRQLRGNAPLLGRQYATASPSPIDIAAPFPSPEFGTIRERLAHWQGEYGHRVAQIIREHQAADPTSEFIDQVHTDADFGQSEERRLAEYWDVIGEPGANLRRKVVAPGYLVEIV